MMKIIITEMKVNITMRDTITTMEMTMTKKIIPIMTTVLTIKDMTMITVNRDLLLDSS